MHLHLRRYQGSICRKSSGGPSPPLPYFSPPLPFPSLFPPLPPSLPFPSLPLEVGPLNPAMGPGGTLKSNFVHFSLKI